MIKTEVIDKIEDRVKDTANTWFKDKIKDGMKTTSKIGFARQDRRHFKEQIKLKNKIKDWI